MLGRLVTKKVSDALAANHNHAAVLMLTEKTIVATTVRLAVVTAARFDRVKLDGAFVAGNHGTYSGTRNRGKVETANERPASKLRCSPDHAHVCVGNVLLVRTVAGLAHNHALE